MKNLEANLSALDVILSKEELEELSAAFPMEQVMGDRYPPGLTTYVEN